MNRSRAALFALLTLLSCSPPAVLPAGDPAPPLLNGRGKKARVAVYGGEGAFADSITASLNMFRWMGADAKVLAAPEIGSGALRDYDILYMTGGWAPSYLRDLRGKGVNEIRSFVKGGGGYIGICAGAYFAAKKVVWEGSSYDYPLGLFPGSAEGPISAIAPWPEKSMCSVDLSTSHPAAAGLPSALSVIYAGGPWFRVPAKPGFSVVGRYAANGEPAMTAFNYGKGRVFLSGAHPEFEEGGPRDGARWDDDFTDEESDWPLMLEAARWLLRER